VEEGRDVEKYYCDICDTSYDESELIPKKKVYLIEKTPDTKKIYKRNKSKKSSKSRKIIKKTTNSTKKGKFLKGSKKSR